MEKVMNERPMVLHVEDEQGVRETAKRLFEAGGIDVVFAATEAEAKESFKRKASALACVVTDIRLRRARDDDSGAKFAEWVSATDPTMPIVVYTAYGDRYRDRLSCDLLLEKGGADPDLELGENIDRILELCDQHASRRFKGATDTLLRIKEKYQISDSDFQLLAAVWPLQEVAEAALLPIHEALDSDQDPPTTMPVSAESSTLIIIQPDDPLASEFSLKKPIPLVVRYQANDHMFLVELYASPTIYAYGEERDEAVKYLISSLREDFDRMQADSNGYAAGIDIARFQRYLRVLFNI